MFSQLFSSYAVSMKTFCTMFLTISLQFFPLTPLVLRRLQFCTRLSPSLTDLDLLLLATFSVVLLPSQLSFPQCAACYLLPELRPLPPHLHLHLMRYRGLDFFCCMNLTQKWQTFSLSYLQLKLHSMNCLLN